MRGSVVTETVNQLRNSKMNYPTEKYENQIIATGEKNNIDEDIIIEAVEWFGTAIRFEQPPKSSMNRIINMMLETKQEID